MSIESPPLVNGNPNPDSNLDLEINSLAEAAFRQYLQDTYGENRVLMSKLRRMSNHISVLSIGSLASVSISVKDQILRQLIWEQEGTEKYGVLLKVAGSSLGKAISDLIPEDGDELDRQRECFDQIYNMKFMKFNSNGRKRLNQNGV